MATHGQDSDPGLRPDGGAGAVLAADAPREVEAEPAEELPRFPGLKRGCLVLIVLAILVMAGVEEAVAMNQKATLVLVFFMNICALIWTVHDARETGTYFYKWEPLVYVLFALPGVTIYMLLRRRWRQLGQLMVFCLALFGAATLLRTVVFRIVTGAWPVVL